MAKRATESSRRVAIGYVRVSSRQQRDEGSSLRDQRDEIASYAVVNNLHLLDIFEDGGISGGKDESGRPGLAGVLRVLAQGEASVLIVKHLDRLARDTDLAGYLRVQVKRLGCSLAVIDEVDDPIRRAVDSLAAELERIRGSQRMRFSHRMRKQQGLWTGGAPFGYRLVQGKLVPLEDELRTVRRVDELRRDGKTIRAIAVSLNEEQRSTRSGRPWSPSTVHEVVRRLRHEDASSPICNAAVSP